MSEKPLVLLSPLNWGLGHATRCIPVIKSLIELDYEVVICGNGNSFHLLKSEFPELKSDEIEGLEMTYSSNSQGFWFSMFRQAPALYKSIQHDKKAVRKLIAKYLPALIISDNRYGFCSKNIPSILITHQLRPIIPALFKLFSFLFYKILDSYHFQFSEIWIPDLADYPGLSGKLSHRTSLKHKKVVFCGPLSRFAENEILSEPDYSSDIFVIISGPEPQRQLFEDAIRTKFANTERKVVVILGLPAQQKTEIIGNMTIFSHLPQVEFFKYLKACKLVLARSGYSTIMDLFYTKKPAILIPTPGQTEQIYLAELHESTGNFIKGSAENDLNKLVDNFFNRPYKSNFSSNSLQTDTLKKICLSIKKNAEYQRNSAFSSV